jgi:transposase
LIRRALTDGQWQRIEPLIPGKKGDKGRHGADNRLFVDAVLWLVRAGAPCTRPARRVRQLEQRVQTLPTMGKKGRLAGLFAELGENPDLEYLIIDSTIVRAHQHAAGAQKGGAKMRRSGVRAVA